MATGRSMQLTKMAGEYLVCAELCRRGLLATTLMGNVPEFDTFATDKRWQHETQPELDVLIPSILAKAFMGELQTVFVQIWRIKYVEGMEERG